MDANNSSFNKIMMGDFSTRLGVPPAFDGNFENLDLSRNFTVCLVEERISWKVKVEKSSDGFYDFTKGWSKIVKDLHLAQGDFLVFHLVHAYAFQLRLNPPPPPPPPTTSTSTSSVNEEVERELNTHFVRYTESASRRCFCILPESFGKKIYKECNDYNDVLIKDDGGRKWDMKLKLRVQPTYHRYELITGWRDFCASNDVVVGDKLEFKHIHGSTIEVVVHHQ